MSNQNKEIFENTFKYISSESFLVPNYIERSSGPGHVPFFFWLINIIKPKNVVELGTWYGLNYFVFCQACKFNNNDAKCYAIDTWLGDEHMGKHDESVFQCVQQEFQKNYSGTENRLLKTSFDEAAKLFEILSIDFLFIDGSHTYEAVANDFHTWITKMSQNGVIAFHDISVEENNFGVKKFWNEIKYNYPHFEFFHNHGLGIILVGTEPPVQLYNLISESNATKEKVRAFYAALGERIELMMNNKDNIRKINNLSYNNSLLESSFSWKITKPFRKIADFIFKII